MERCRDKIVRMLLCKAFAIGYRVCESEVRHCSAWKHDSIIQLEANHHVDTLLRESKVEASPVIELREVV